MATAMGYQSLWNNNRTTWASHLTPTKVCLVAVGEARSLRAACVGLGWRGQERAIPYRQGSARAEALPERNGGVIALVIGDGGREHALCYGLHRSSSCGGVFCAPGNVGISRSHDATCLADLDVSNSSAVINFCKDRGVGLVVVGPEAPLVAGLVDDLSAAGIHAFGPSARASALEGSKTFMKNLCDKYGIPTAKYRTFTDAETAKEYLRREGVLPIVVKADGLAAGKGVTVATTLEEAYGAVDKMLKEGALGSAGETVVVEEFLDGEEVSFFALVDGEAALPFGTAQDHKRVGDGDTGPNTGGMGAYSPAPMMNPHLEAEVMESVIMPTVRGMAEQGRKFVGVLYAGLMIDRTTAKPKLLEYNVRFGDPECQVLMMRLQSDLVQLLLAACKEKLKECEVVQWSKEAALAVVLASKGYPGEYKKETIIKQLKEAESTSKYVKLFHARTGLDVEGNIVARGGRTLSSTGLGRDISKAQARAYQAVDALCWPGGFCRRDIGAKAVAREKEAAANSSF